MGKLLHVRTDLAFFPVDAPAAFRMMGCSQVLLCLSDTVVSDHGSQVPCVCFHFAPRRRGP